MMVPPVWESSGRGLGAFWAGSGRGRMVEGMGVGVGAGSDSWDVWDAHLTRSTADGSADSYQLLSFLSLSLSLSFSLLLLLSADPSLVERVRAGMPGTHSYFHSFPPFSHAHSPPRELPNLAQSSPTIPITLPQTSPRAPQQPRNSQSSPRLEIPRVSGSLGGAPGLLTSLNVA